MASDIDRIDQAALLQQYGLTTLDPQKWESVENEDAAHLVLDSGAGDGMGGGGGGREMDDPLGLLGKLAIPRDMDINELAATLISSKTFSPSAFLSLHHPDATFQDLQLGVQRLRRNVESKGEEVRILVEREFGRFVGVKGSGDAVYRDMKLDMLADGSDHGTRETRELVKITSHKAETIFLPLLSNALKAQKLKSTAGVFERSKFLFGLPRDLRMYIRAGKYEAALRDYNKGLYLRDSRPNQLLPLSNSTSNASNNIFSPTDGTGPSFAAGLDPTNSSNAGDLQARKDQQKRVFDKIWVEVERIMEEMKGRLERGLRETGGKSVEDVEKSIEILLELKPREDPVWIYLDAAHANLLDKLTAVYSAQMANVQAVRQASLQKPMDDRAQAHNLRRCVDRLIRKGGDATISKSARFEQWEAIAQLINKVSAVLVNGLPDFWRVAKGHMEGKYDQRNGYSRASKRQPAQGRAMAIEIIKVYISLISQFFTLSDVSVASTSTNPNQAGIPSFVPDGSNSITTCHFVSKILADIVESVSELDGIGGTIENEKYGSQVEAKNALKALVESCRWRFEEAICETWSKDARAFFHLENWAINALERTTTTYLDRIAALQRHNATVAWQVAGGSIEPGASKAAVPQTFITKIKNSFFDSLYYLLDGLVHLAFSEEPPLLEDETSVSSLGLPSVVLNDKDRRVILTISNLQHLKKTTLPDFMRKFEQMYGISTKGDRGTLDEVVDQLDKILLDDFIKRKGEKLMEISERGLILDGMEWAEGAKPTEIRPYLLKDLLFMVHVHSQVNGIAPALVLRIMQALLVELASILLQCMKQISRMGMGGMLSATLEVEFLHQTLLQYVTEASTAILNDIYAVISTAYSRKSDEDDLQRELEDLKKVLLDYRRATGVQFVCFKPTKP